MPYPLPHTPLAQDLIFHITNSENLILANFPGSESSRHLIFGSWLHYLLRIDVILDRGFLVYKLGIAIAHTS